MNFHIRELFNLTFFKDATIDFIISTILKMFNNIKSCMQLNLIALVNLLGNRKTVA
ncbi:hypothetical protein FLAN108750_04635 [Flavobacterium antarcticum]